MEHHQPNQPNHCYIFSYGETPGELAGIFSTVEKAFEAMMKKLMRHKDVTKEFTLEQAVADPTSFFEIFGPRPLSISRVSMGHFMEDYVILFNVASKYPYTKGKTPDYLSPDILKEVPGIPLDRLYIYLDAEERWMLSFEKPKRENIYQDSGFPPVPAFVKCNKMFKYDEYEYDKETEFDYLYYIRAQDVYVEDVKNHVIQYRRVVDGRYQIEYLPGRDSSYMEYVTEEAYLQVPPGHHTNISWKG